MTDPEIKFEALFFFVKEKKRFPYYNEGFTYNNQYICICNIYHRLLFVDTSYKDTRDEWIKKLASISPEIKEKILTIQNRPRIKKVEQSNKVNQKINIEIKFHALYRYMEENNRIPVQNFIYQYGDIKIPIGTFISQLLNNVNLFKKNRKSYIERLKAISPKIKVLIEEREK